MKFTEAFKISETRSKVKLPSCVITLVLGSEKKAIMIQCRQRDGDRELLDIRETQSGIHNYGNLLSDEWIVADEKNCPVLGGEATLFVR